MAIKNKEDLDFAWLLVHYAENKLDEVDDRKRLEEYCVKVYCFDGEGEELICEEHGVKEKDLQKYYDVWLNLGLQYWVEVEKE